MKTKTVVALVFGAINHSAHAATTASVSQTFNFPFSFSGVTTSSSGQSVFFPNSGNNVATVLPFNTALGTLNSVDLNWDWGISFSGESSGGVNGGSVSLNMGGSTYVGAVSYSGSGTGGGNSVGPNTQFSAVAPQAFVHKNYTAAGAGLTYAAIWTAISGNSSYAAKLVLGGPQTYTDLASGTFTANTDLVVTYNYTAAAIPEPSSTCALLGLCALGLVARRRMA